MTDWNYLMGQYLAEQLAETQGCPRLGIEDAKEEQARAAEGTDVRPAPSTVDER